MKPVIIFCTLLLLAAGCSNTKPPESKNNIPVNDTNAQSNVVDQTVLASCGQCKFGMPGTGCNLAIKLNGETYFVAGTSIDEHGDAHSEDGLCNCIRQAKVTGKVKEGRFVAVAFQLLPLDTVTEQAASDQN